MKVFMFHYVLPKSNYYYYDLNLFEKTIKYFKDNYKIISLKQYDELKEKKIKVDDTYVMLTFDDGTIDHYNYVYKILKKYCCSGLFFITSAIFDNQVLDIQIIHKLISLNLINEIYETLLSEIKKYNIQIDNIEINISETQKEIEIKKLLQYVIPEFERKQILYSLAKKYKISYNSKKYYMSLKNINEMLKNNMFFGLHTKTHPRLSLLSEQQKNFEIKENLEVLKEKKIVDDKYISIAYPYGCYDKSTIDILKKMNIKYGFSIENNFKDNNFEIKRIDCKFLKEEIWKNI